MSRSHRHKRHRSDSPSPAAATATFPSYMSTPNLPPNVRHLCHLIATTPSSSLEQTPAVSAALSSITPSDLELVLKLSYAHPTAAIKLFRWAAARSPPTPYAWNLAVDLLGRNRLFAAMWDIVASMRQRKILSLATFASIFSSFAAGNDTAAALRAFDDMAPCFHVARDAPALNSLVSAFCREGRPSAAHDFLRLRRDKVRPDADTYAILLEGWENAGDHRRSRDAFDEMTACLGWAPQNVPAYDSFLCTLLRGAGPDEAMRYLSTLKGKGCYPGAKFFRMAMAELEKADDVKGANSLWETLVGRNGCYPDSGLFHSMILLQCRAGRLEAALKYLDEMVVYGAFPGARTYNVLLKYLLKEKETTDAAAIFNEMVKNELVPSEENCTLAVRVFIGAREAEAAQTGIKVWKCMVENGYSAEESGNDLIDRLKGLDMLPEACKFAEDMIARRVKLTSASLSKLKTSLLKVGKGNVYDHILMKWKLH